MTPAAIAAAYRRACALDVEVAKPGNVSLAAPGHGMTAQDFLRSAAASAGPISDPALGVGERIEAAIEATWAAVGCNTNLGIVLLCAPLAVAAGRLAAAGPGAGRAVDPAAAAEPDPTTAQAAALHAAVQQVLDGLDVADARAAFRAIARARPAGLGQAEQGDVHDEARITLREAMALAAGRDLIARQYSSDYAEMFERALPQWRAAQAQAQAQGQEEKQARLVAAEGAATAGWSGAQPVGRTAMAQAHAMLGCFLAWLARHPDSHIVRKHGEAAAQSVTREAAVHHAAWIAGSTAGLAAWDAELKRRALNPGTSADLSVATAFIACLTDASAHPAADQG